MASLPCDKCGSSDAVEPYEDGDKCFSCGWKNRSGRLKLESDDKKQKNPKKIQLTTITDFWINWLKQRGINEKTIRAFNIQFDKLSESIAYPCVSADTKKILGYQLRDKNKKIKTVRYAKEDEPFLFECRANDASIVVVVEDPVSAMRIWQDARINVVALMGTNLRNTNKLYLVGKYDRVLVWMDGDLAGYKAARHICNDLSQYNYTHIIFTTNDPKDHNSAVIKYILEQQFRLAGLSNE